MLILAQFCKWASCYQTTWAICAVNFYFYRSNKMSLWPYKGKYCVQIRQVVGIGYRGGI